MTTGSNYTNGLSTKDITAKVREYVKKNFPGFKFSVTVESGTWTNSLHIALMQGTREVYKTFDELTKEERKEIRSGYARSHNIGSYYPNELDKEIKEGEFSGSLGYIPQYMLFLADGVREAVQGVKVYAYSFHYDNSNPMTDYFETNFYFHKVEIGKWDKPYNVA